MACDSQKSLSKLKTTKNNNTDWGPSASFVISLGKIFQHIVITADDWSSTKNCQIKKQSPDFHNIHTHAHNFLSFSRLLVCFFFVCWSIFVCKSLDRLCYPCVISFAITFISNIMKMMSIPTERKANQNHNADEKLAPFASECGMYVFWVQRTSSVLCYCKDRVRAELIDKESLQIMYIYPVEHSMG